MRKRNWIILGWVWGYKWSRGKTECLRTRFTYYYVYTTVQWLSWTNYINSLSHSGLAFKISPHRFVGRSMKTFQHHAQPTLSKCRPTFPTPTSTSITCQSFTTVLNEGVLALGWEIDVWPSIDKTILYSFIQHICRTRSEPGTIPGARVTALN